MLGHYFTTALRQARRHRLTTAIGVGGLALGLACFIAACGAVAYFTNGDRQFANIDRTYVIAQRIFSRTQNFDTGFRSSGSLAVARYLRSDFPELPAVAAVSEVAALSTFVDGRRQFVDAIAADADLLRIFDFTFMQMVDGNPLLRPRHIILTEDAALRLFGTPHVLGRTVRLENALDVSVGGVIERLPRTSYFFKQEGTSHFNEIAERFGFEMILTRDTYVALEEAIKPRRAPNWGVFVNDWGFSTHTYALLPEDGSLTPARLNDHLVDFAHRHGVPHTPGARFESVTHRAIPLAQMRLTALERTLFRNSEGMSLVAVLLWTAALVLVVAGVNYASLTIARGLANSHEVGIRRVLGASRWKIFSQHVVEACLHTGVAAIIAITLVFTIAGIVDARTDMDLLGAVSGSGRFWVAVLSGCLLLALLVGSYPALSLSRLNVRQALGSRRGFSAGTNFRLVVVVQFAIAGVLLIGLMIAAVQNAHLRESSRVDEDPIVVLRNGWAVAGASIDNWRSALSGNPAIKGVSAVAATPWSESWALADLARQPGLKGVGTIATFVHHDFEQALSMSVMAGRSFDRSGASTGSDTAPGSIWWDHGIVIDHSLARQLGFATPHDAVDQMVYHSTDNGPVSAVRIIGVVEDRPLRLLPVFGHTGNLYRLDVSGNPLSLRTLVIRVAHDAVPAGLEAIDAAWGQLSDAPVNRRFADELFDVAYAKADRAAALLTVLSCIALGTSVMGLFAMAAFVTTRRTHEIGIRKTLGARAGQLVAMLVRDLSWPVVLANLVAWPVAYVAVSAWISLFIQRIELKPWPFLASMAIALGVAWIAVGGHAWRAARVQPATVLRHE